MPPLIFLVLPLMAKDGIVADSFRENPKEITHDINEKGAKAALNELYPKDYSQREYAKWNYVLSRIASGNPRWVEIAKKLRSVAIGRPLKDIDAAIGHAVVHNPKAILTFIGLISGAYTPTNGKYDSAYVDRTCGFINVEEVNGTTYDTLRRYISEINKREKALQTVMIPSLQPWKHLCIQALEKCRENAPAQFKGTSGASTMALKRFFKDYQRLRENIRDHPEQGWNDFVQFIQKYPNENEFDTTYEPVAMTLLINQREFEHFIRLAGGNRQLLSIVMKELSMAPQVYKSKDLETVINNVKRHCPPRSEAICEQVWQKTQGKLDELCPNNSCLDVSTQPKAENSEGK